MNTLQDTKVEIPLTYYQTLEQSATVLTILLGYIEECIKEAKDIAGEEPHTIVLERTVVDAIQEGLL